MTPRRLQEFRVATETDTVPSIHYVRRTCQRCKKPQHPGGGRVIEKRFICRGCLGK